MADKPALNMMPAPRPRRLNDPADTQALQDATRDLGFGRPTSEGAADLKPAEPVAKAPEDTTKAVAAPKVVAPKAETQAPKPKVVVPPAPVPSALLAPLKFDIDRELSNFLKMEAVRRGATVKFLILEALAGKGYPVDMANTPEDGRRPRREA